MSNKGDGAGEITHSNFPNGESIPRDHASKREQKLRRIAREALTPEAVRAITADMEWPGIEDERQLLFLSALSICGVLAQSARIAKVNRNTIYGVWQHNETFAKHMELAKSQIACDLLEEEAWSRALDGVKEPVFHQGFQIGSVTRYSDTLLVQLLRGYMPEKYGTKVSMKHSVDDSLSSQLDAMDRRLRESKETDAEASEEEAPTLQ